MRLTIDDIIRTIEELEMQELYSELLGSILHEDAGDKD